ncbi:hypothetical protein EVAR_100957_1 [Eumeta japonica]|uniref:Uncharacterized protein n=1 Tax=Eumeta variegata TaxID=151549 RepID=A0A4C2A542_EUMVA|nr:hypothetical protein EVAR_100957_1 [Eumeta japonica]
MNPTKTSHAALSRREYVVEKCPSQGGLQRAATEAQTTSSKWFSLHRRKACTSVGSAERRTSKGYTGRFMVALELRRRRLLGISDGRSLYMCRRSWDNVVLIFSNSGFRRWLKRPTVRQLTCKKM